MIKAIVHLMGMPFMNHFDPLELILTELLEWQPAVYCFLTPQFVLLNSKQ